MRNSTFSDNERRQSLLGIVFLCCPLRGLKLTHPQNKHIMFDDEIIIFSICRYDLLGAC